MTAQSVWKRAGDLTAQDIGKGIWARIRYLPREQWPTDLPEADDPAYRYEWGWARITMVTHTSKGVTKVRIRGGGLVDWSYETGERVNLTVEEFTR